ncbi:MAG: response regulator transcription factor [Thermodesulfovibrionales bacterium]
MPIRVAIGCCNRIFAEGLKMLLEDESDIEVIGTFDESPDFLLDLENILKLNPDVILADYSADFNILLSLPEEFLSLNRLKIILIGDRSLRFIADKQLKELVLKGVVGILPPSADSELLKKALNAVFSGEVWLDRNTLMKIFNSMKKQEKNVNLSKREKEIVLHICQGYRNKEIAQKLNVSEQTVKSHCTSIYKKIGVTDRLQLALYSYKIWPDNTKI